MTDPRILSEMPESATSPQSDIPTEPQPVIIEPRLVQEPPPGRWRVSRSALLLIGVPLAGALVVWLALSLFSSDPADSPEVVAEQPAAEPAMEAQPAVEPPPANEESVASVAEPEPAPAEPVAAAEPAPAEPMPAEEPLPAADPEPREQPDAAVAAMNEVTPNVPQSALDTIRGTVRVSVRVTVDGEGKVVEATADDPGPSRYFERLAVGAAKKWTFVPESSAEQRTMLVKFNFTREGVTAQASS